MKLKKFIKFIASAAVGCALASGFVAGKEVVKVLGEDKTPAPAYDVTGWTEYMAGSVSKSENGILMGNAADGKYQFSNTTKESYQVDGLSVSYRYKDQLRHGSSGQMMIYIGLVKDDVSWMSADAVGSFGVACWNNIVTDDYCLFSGTANNDSTTPVPYINHIFNTNGALASNDGVFTFKFFRASETYWYVLLDGSRQLEITGESAALLESYNSTGAHLAIAGYDYKNPTTAQTGKIEVLRVNGEILGNATNDLSYTVGSSYAATNSFDLTDNGLKIETTTAGEGGIDYRVAVPTDHKSQLDGASISFKVDIENANNAYVMDVGFGTFHGPDRCTFWDSYSDKPSIVGSFGVRFNGLNAPAFLLITRVASEGHNGGYTTETCFSTYDALFGPSNMPGGVHTLSLAKYGENWQVFIDGRNFPSSNPNFQAHLNATIDSLENSGTEVVAPWFQLCGITGKTEGYKSTTTIFGYGQRRSAYDTTGQAVAWANYFIDLTRGESGPCLLSNDTDKLNGLKAIWDDLSSEYSAMSDDSKNVFYNNTEILKIIEARDHYKYIISKFGSSGLTDFVTDSSGNKLARNTKPNLVSIFSGSEDNTSLVMIVTLSTISVLTLGICFVYRKKKEI